MNNNNDKRSSTIRMNNIDQTRHGVGARQTDKHTTTGGGGYPDICTKNEFSKNGFEKKMDPRIIELKKMDLGNKWVRIAEGIGFDAFMLMWSILDESNINSGSKSSEPVRMWIPAFRRYLRFQRNNYILSRGQNKESTPEVVQKEVKELLGESLSLPHIKRIMDKVNIS